MLQQSRRLCLPDPELQAGVRFLSAVVEHHAAADHKGVLIQERVRDAVLVAENGLLASLALIQALKPNQW